MIEFIEYLLDGGFGAVQLNARKYAGVIFLNR